jgi:hypothetical protein
MRVVNETFFHSLFSYSLFSEFAPVKQNKIPLFKITTIPFISMDLSISLNHQKIP